MQDKNKTKQNLKNPTSKKCEHMFKKILLNVSMRDNGDFYYKCALCGNIR